MKIFRILCILACFGFLIGCASTVKPLAKNTVENKTFVLVPTGQISYEVVSNRTGGAFGLLGALIEAAVTQSSSAALQERLRESVPPEFMMQTATKQIEADLKKYGNYRLVVAKDHTLKDLPYSEWSKNLKRDDLKGDLLANADVIVDVGMTNVSLIKALGGTYANLGISIRFIDRNSGNMHGEVKEFTSSGVNDINFDLDEDSATYPTDVKNAFERLIRKSVSTALEKVFDVPPSTQQPQLAIPAQQLTTPSTQQPPLVIPAGKIVTQSITQNPDPITPKIVNVTNCSFKTRLNYLDGTNGCLEDTPIASEKTNGASGTILEAVLRSANYAIARSKSSSCKAYGFASESGIQAGIKSVKERAIDACNSQGCSCELIVAGGGVVISKEQLLVLKPVIEVSAQTLPPKMVEIKQTDVIKQVALPANSSDGAKRLIELKSLLDKGLITQKDYDLKKQEILKSM